MDKWGVTGSDCIKVVDSSSTTSVGSSPSSSVSCGFASASLVSSFVTFVSFDMAAMNSLSSYSQIILAKTNSTFKFFGTAGLKMHRAGSRGTEPSLFNRLWFT